jgi:hypothetical protein
MVNRAGWKQVFPWRKLPKGPATLGTETGGARRKEWEEASGDRGGTEVSRAAASAMGQWRGLRTAAQPASDRVTGSGLV